MHRRLAPKPPARRIGRGAVCVAGLVLHGLQPLAFAQFGAGEPTTSTGRTAKLVYPQVTLAPQSREYQPIPIQDSESAKAIWAALNGHKTTEVFNFDDKPLRQLVSLVEDTCQIKVHFDYRAMDAAGLDVDATTVSGDFSNMTLRSALRRILQYADMTFTVVDDVLLFTTVDEAHEHLVGVAYPLPCGIREAGNHVIDVQSLIDLVQNAFAVDSWIQTGGPGSISPILTGGEVILVVSQTLDVHHQVEAFLRRLHERSFADFDGGCSVLRIHHVDDATQRADLVASLKDLCNAALSDHADERATVSALGKSVVILSKSAEFHGLAGQVIAAVANIPQAELDSSTAGQVRPLAAGVPDIGRSLASVQPHGKVVPRTTELPATQTPSATQTFSFDPAAIERALQVAYAAIRNGDFDAASAVIDSVVVGADPAIRARLDRWKRFTVYARGYSELRAKAYRAAVNSEFEIGDRVIVIVEVDGEQIVLRDSGKQMSMRLDELPAEIDRAIIEQWVGRDGRAANHLFLGASHLARDRPSPTDALREWRRAASAGESDGMLLLYPLVMDSVIVPVETATAASQ